MKERELFFWIGVGVYITGWFIAAALIRYFLPYKIVVQVKQDKGK